MKWIVFQHINSQVAALNYYNSIKIAYLLNLKVVSVGFDDIAYFYCEMAQQLPVEAKLGHLLNANKNFPDSYEVLVELQQSLKILKKIKFKSSKQIVAINSTQRTIDKLFKTLQENSSEVFENKFGLSTLKILLEEDIFYFYNTSYFNKSTSYLVQDLHTELLQLKLPDSEKGNPLFFLSNFSENGVVMEMDFLDPNSKEAEDKTTFYGELSYTFPLLDTLSSTELSSIRKDLEQTTLEFRAKIDEWATVCYANPNTNLGLEFFRKKLQPFLQATTNGVLENPLLKNASSLTHKNLESQIRIGEAPIQKIWELYLHSNTITQEVYDELMNIKTEQYPKFEGRWPVVFFKPTDDAEKHLSDATQNDGVKSVRKSISLD